MSRKKVKKDTRRKDRPKNLETKEDLVRYLEMNTDTELPFVQECWDAALELAEKNKEKEINKLMLKKDENGNEIAVPQKIGVAKTPTALYFQLVSLAKYRKIGEKITNDKLLNTDPVADISNLYFDDIEESKPELDDEIVVWIKSLQNDYEQRIMKAMYSKFLNSYDINEGVGKTTLKGILSIGLELDRIDRLRGAGKDVDYKKEKELRASQQNLFDTMKWQPKQRNIRDEMAQNKFTVWMDKMVKNGGFKPNKKHYDPDEVDFILETIVENQRKMLQ